MYRHPVTLVLILISVLFVQAQKIDNKKELDKYFAAAFKGESYYLSSEIIKSLPHEPFIKYINNNLYSDNTFVRYKAVDLVRRKGMYSEDTGIRSVYIKLLLEACRDEDSGVSGVASKALTRYSRSDFDEVSKDNIVNLLKLKSFHYESIVKLVGFLEIDAGKEYLHAVLNNDTTLTNKIIWAVHLSLARMNDEESIRYCIDKVKATRVDDNAILYLFPDLIYTRQPEAINYILREILSDEKKCTSSNPDSEADIICAYKIMEQIAPVIDNFPLSVTDYGELEINDYDKDLIKVREWIKGQKELHINKEYF